MRKSILTTIILLAALTHLGAADLIRPNISLTPSPNGVLVSLDFQHIPEARWREMLENPHAFHEFGYGVAGNPGDAALPMLTELIPGLPTGVISISDIQRQDYSLAEFALKAAPAGHLDSDQQAVPIVAYDWNRTNRVIQRDIISGEAVQMQGQSFLPLTVHPIRMDSESHSLRIPTTIQFEIHGFDLAEDVELTEQGSVRSVRLPEEQFAPKGHYLIITPPQFQDYISYFADWKLRMGYEVTVISTATTGSSATTIKNYIQNAWDSWESRPDFLVLVGDEDQGIPGHYIQNPQGENLVTDHNYACLEGDDSFPELLVGRLSVDTISELVSFTAKIVAYESNPYMAETDWFQRALMISTNWGAASAQATKEWVAAKLLDSGFDQVYTAYHPNQSSTSDISTPINAGVGFVNYRGFGMYNGWFGPDFVNNDIYNLIRNGAKTPVITSVVCGGGNFAANEDPCFGEVWTRIGTFGVPKGAVAFFGPSELHTHTQFNNVIDIGIYSGIFDLGITTLGEALWNGKLELWRNYYQNTFFPFDQTPEFYHHIYNLLGDPGMQLWTATPQLLVVSHADTLISGDNSTLVMVSDTLGNPVQGAYVALYNTDFSSGGYTDANGAVNLPFSNAAIVLPRDATLQDDVQLTVTGTNMFPYLATLPIIDTDYPLSLYSWTFENEGQLTAGTTSDMSLSLYNSGAALSDVNLNFSSSSDGIILTESINIPSIPSFSFYNLGPSDIVTAANLKHGQPVTINLDIQAAGMLWTWSSFLIVQAPVLNIHALNLVSGNLDSGDSAQVELELINSGGAPSGPLTLTALDHDLISFTVNEVGCENINIDGLGSADGTLGLIFSDQIFPAEKILLQFECVSANTTDTLEIELIVGEPSRYGPSQADDYGYRMFDNLDLAYTKSMSYAWIEIDPAFGGFGTNLQLNDQFEENDASTVVNLPFPVSYYGETYTTLTVCSNGWAAFGSQTVVDFHNRRIPSPIGPLAMLAPYWDDLTTNPGHVFSRNFAAGEAFVIEWNRMENLRATNNLSFQIVIYDTEEYPTLSGDNDIKFQYKNYENIDVEANFSTIGIESPNYETGIQASYNAINDPSIGPLGNGKALLFSTDRGTRLPDAVAAVSSTDLSFVLNPWSSARDSIVITNVGESPLAYSFDVQTTLDQIPPAPPAPDRNATKNSPNEELNVSPFREGSDEYGYFWKKDSDVGGPIYNWIDIETTQNALVHLGDPDDSSIGPVAMEFEFPFYDGVFSNVFISSNGSISFMGNYAPWENLHLPTTSAPSALIAPWWDDLNNDAGPQGTIYFWSNGVDECVITWKDFPKFGTTDLYTFQMLMDAFGKIRFQYKYLGGVTNSSTIGMQSPGRNVGLTIHHNEDTPFEAESAISIHPPVPWFTGSGWSGQIEAGESSAFVVDIQSLNLDPGHYTTALTLTTSAGNYPETDLSVSLDVILGQPPYGDLNQDYLLDIRDLMEMLDFILLIEEMTEEQFELADISLDGELNVIDVILLLEAIEDIN